MQHTINIHGSLLNAEIEGSGASLLLVHGFPLDHQMWRYQIAEFSATGK
ncbi:MAG: hypothetical protein R3B90_10645 [Planctomycetaceae bacterium]